MATQVVTELGPDDVLFGRGAPIVQTSGNVRFRDLVNANKVAYASTRCRHTKDSIARDIIQVIDERGGRFLKEIKSTDDAQKYDVPAGVKAWIVAEYDEIVEKVKQTLRETEKSSAERDADSNFKDRLARLNDNSIPDNRISASAAVGNDTQLHNHFLQQGPLHSVSSSLLPRYQQQLLTLQHNIRRNQIQQELALSLQQHQNQALAASFGTNVRGGVTPNILTHPLASSIGSSFPGQRSSEDYHLASQIDHLGAMTNRHFLSTMPSNNYLTSVPSNVLSSLNTSQSAIDEILERDAMLAALRRHRLQIEASLQGQSSILPNTRTPQTDAPSADASFTNFSTMVSSEQLRETPTISNVRQLDEITSSLEPQQNYDPHGSLSHSVRPVQSPIEGINITKPVPLSDSVVRLGDESKKKRATTDNEDESSTPSKKKKRQEE